MIIGMGIPISHNKMPPITASPLLTGLMTVNATSSDEFPSARWFDSLPQRPPVIPRTGLHEPTDAVMRSVMFPTRSGTKAKLGTAADLRRAMVKGAGLRPRGDN
jgi:hypothetical protein